MLSAEQLSCRYGRQSALDSVDLEVRPRELVAVVGPTGAGKTTLLECFLGLRAPSSGRARVIDHDEPDHAGHPASLLAYVPAVLALPRATLLARYARDQCAAIGRRMPEQVVHRALARGGISSEWHAKVLAECPPAVHRKLAIALATLKNAGGLLLDEPTHGLDPSDIDSLITSLRLIRKGGAAILLATRDLAFARRVAMRIALLERGAVVETFDLTTSRRAFHADSYLSNLVA